MADRPTSPQPTQPALEFTNYSLFVTEAVKAGTTKDSRLDQEVLRVALGLCSSYLVTDTCTNSDPTRGSQTWFTVIDIYLSDYGMLSDIAGTEPANRFAPGPAHKRRA
ncbi:hypothetical protein C8F01DRAFT_1117647 [Mycena amicta]|nr:hypothetical protein C8F01DRAFT_1117647 [Mycena amicta]